MSVTFNSETEDMLKILALSLKSGEEDKDSKTSTDQRPRLTKQIYAELRKHAVHLLIDERFVMESGDDELIQIYSDDMMRNISGFHTVMLQQESLLGLFRDAGIDYVILKGAAAAINYDRYECRCMGDIDIIVEPRNYEQAFNLMQANGYEPEQVLNDVTRHADFHSPSEIEIELHKYFSSSPDKKQNRILDNYIYNGINKAVTRQIDDYSFSMLPEFENGLVLLGHINYHIIKGLGLRQIIDWIMYVRKYLDDAAWNSGFSDAADSIGIKKLAIIITLMCKRYLGLENSITWCDIFDTDHNMTDSAECSTNINPDVVDDLMEYILMNGDFGRKIEEGSRNTLAVMRIMRSPAATLKYLTAGGVCHWTAAQKHAVLRPFAWIYQVGHLIRKGTARNENPETFIKERKQSRREIELLKELGVTRL